MTDSFDGIPANAVHSSKDNDDILTSASAALDAASRVGQTAIIRYLGRDGVELTATLTGMDRDSQSIQVDIGSGAGFSIDVPVVEITRWDIYLGDH